MAPISAFAGNLATSVEALNGIESAKDRAAHPRSMEHCDYSVVLCTQNRAQFVEPCLRAILREMLTVNRRGEVLLVDNASTDNTKLVFDRTAVDFESSHLKLSYLFEAHPGISIARNRGIAAAQGDIIVFIDDDAVPQSGWLSACLSAFDQRPTAMVVGGEILPLISGVVPEWFRAPLIGVYSILHLDGSGVRPFPGRTHPLGANMAFRKSVFVKHRFSERLGRKGTNLMSGEEAELCALARRDGGEILYAPNMKIGHVIHADRLTEQWVLKRYYYEGICRARMELGRLAQAMAALEMAAKLVALFITRPFARAEFPRLLWKCRLYKTLGYFTQLAGCGSNRRDA